MPKVYIPVAMRKFTDNQSTVKVNDVSTIANLLQSIQHQYPGIENQLRNQNGKINPYIAVFVNNTDIRDLEEVNTPVSEKDEIHIIQAIAGG